MIQLSLIFNRNIKLTITGDDSTKSMYELTLLRVWVWPIQFVGDDIGVQGVRNQRQKFLNFAL